MIKIQNLTHVGYDGKLEIINFEFVFDNTSYLPTKVYSMGQNNYIIADGSTATNVITGAKYTYNNYNWTKQQGSGEPVNPKSSEITNNGTYSIMNNEAKGFNSVNVNIEGGGNLIEKTITENGEYLPTDDEADGYSKVVVDVPSESNPHFNRIVCGCIYDNTHLSPFYIFTSQNGQYTVSATESLYPRIYLANPLTTVELDGAFNIYFTPSADFNPNTAFKANGSYIPLTQSSTTPQPNDGKVYRANWSRGNGMNVAAVSYVNSESTNFVFTIE